MTGSAFRSSLALLSICSHDDFSSEGTLSQGISAPLLWSDMLRERVSLYWARPSDKIHPDVSFVFHVAGLTVVGFSLQR